VKADPTRPYVMWPGTQYELGRALQTPDKRTFESYKMRRVYRFGVSAERTLELPDEKQVRLPTGAASINMRDVPHAESQRCLSPMPGKLALPLAWRLAHSVDT
jgi:hypothetical protein